jgi:hypothetical protein
VTTSSGQDETEAILATAQPYLDMSADELERLFDEALDEAESTGLPVRGPTDRSFWRAALARLRNDIAGQDAAVSATAVLAASQTATWAHEIGLDLTAYNIPIAIFVAMPVKAILDQIKSDDDSPPGG